MVEPVLRLRPDVGIELVWGASYLVAEILADRGNRSVTCGLESDLATRSLAAVKTGTNKEMRDNWCTGFSDRYTVGVWVGNGGGEPMWNVSGVEGASPIWRTLMDALHTDDSSVAPVPPEVVISSFSRAMQASSSTASSSSYAESVLHSAAIRNQP